MIPLVYKTLKLSTTKTTKTSSTNNRVKNLHIHLRTPLTNPFARYSPRSRYSFLLFIVLKILLTRGYSIAGTRQRYGKLRCSLMCLQKAYQNNCRHPAGRGFNHLRSIAWYSIGIGKRDGSVFSEAFKTVWEASQQELAWFFVAVWIPFRNGGELTKRVHIPGRLMEEGSKSIRRTVSSSHMQLCVLQIPQLQSTKLNGWFLGGFCRNEPKRGPTKRNPWPQYIISHRERVQGEPSAEKRFAVLETLLGKQFP